jgi:hypothetical protein
LKEPNTPHEFWQPEPPGFGLEGTEIELLSPTEKMFRPRERAYDLKECEADPAFLAECINGGLEVRHDMANMRMIVVSRTGPFPDFLLPFTQVLPERSC